MSAGQLSFRQDTLCSWFLLTLAMKHDGEGFGSEKDTADEKKDGEDLRAHVSRTG